MPILLNEHGVDNCLTLKFIFVAIMAHNKTCINCGKAYLAKRSDSETCSNTCRTELHAVRKRWPERLETLKVLSSALQRLMADGDYESGKPIVTEIVRMCKKYPERDFHYSPEVREIFRRIEAKRLNPASEQPVKFSNRQPVLFAPSKADQEAAMKDLSKHFSTNKRLRSKDHPDLTVRGKRVPK